MRMEAAKRLTNLLGNAAAFSMPAALLFCNYLAPDKQSAFLERSSQKTSWGIAINFGKIDKSFRVKSCQALCSNRLDPSGIVPNSYVPRGGFAVFQLRTSEAIPVSIRADVWYLEIPSAVLR